MAQLAALSLKSVYNSNPSVLVDNIKDEITGTDNKSLITENAMVSYVNNLLLFNSRIVNINQICCMYPKPNPQCLRLEYIPQYKQHFIILYDNVNGRLPQIELDTEQKRDNLRCILRYIEKWMMVELRGPLTSYSHLLPPYMRDIKINNN